MKPGDLRYVALDSWAGRSTHLVRVEKVGAARVTVTWLDASVLGRVQGRTYRVPPSALRRVGKSNPGGWNRCLAEGEARG